MKQVLLTLTTELYVQDGYMATDGYYIASLLAERYAMEVGSTELTSLHFLRAILAIDVGITRSILEECGYNVSNLLISLKQVIPIYPVDIEIDIAISSEMRLALDMAISISVEFNHRYIGLEYMLLGLIKADTYAAKFLEDYKIEYQVLYDLLRRIYRKERKRGGVH